MAATVPFVAWLSDTAERDRWVSSLASLPDVGDVGSWIPWEGSTLEDGWCLEVGDVLLVAIDAMGPSLSRSGVPVEAAEWAGSRPIGEGWPPMEWVVARGRERRRPPASCAHFRPSRWSPSPVQPGFGGIGSDESCRALPLGVLRLC
jgi:hypothetical protein